MTALTLNAHHFLAGLTAFENQHHKPMRDYADKLAEAAKEGFNAEDAKQYARDSFALGLLLLGIPDEEEKEESEETE